MAFTLALIKALLSFPFKSEAGTSQHEKGRGGRASTLIVQLAELFQHSWVRTGSCYMGEGTQSLQHFICQT